MPTSRRFATTRRHPKDVRGARRARQAGRTALLRLLVPDRHRFLLSARTCRALAPPPGWRRGRRAGSCPSRLDPTPPFSTPIVAPAYRLRARRRLQARSAIGRTRVPSGLDRGGIAGTLSWWVRSSLCKASTEDHRYIVFALLYIVSQLSGGDNLTCLQARFATSAFDFLAS